jgi:hypothetical protein
MAPTAIPGEIPADELEEIGQAIQRIPPRRLTTRIGTPE